MDFIEQNPNLLYEEYDLIENPHVDLQYILDHPAMPLSHLIANNNITIYDLLKYDIFRDSIKISKNLLTNIPYSILIQVIKQMEDTLHDSYSYIIPYLFGHTDFRLKYLLSDDNLKILYNPKSKKLLSYWSNYYVFKCHEISYDILYDIFQKYKSGQNEIYLNLDGIDIILTLSSNLNNLYENPYFTYQIIKDNPEINWNDNYHFLNKFFMSESDLLDFCLKNKKLIEENHNPGGGRTSINMTPLSFICDNPNITNNFVYQLIQNKFRIKYDYFYKKELINEEIIKLAQLNKVKLNFLKLSSLATISIEFIIEHPYYGWSYEEISKNPNLTEEHIEKYPDIDWSSMIVNNKFTYNKHVYKKNITKYITNHTMIIQNVSTVILQYI